MMKKTLLFLFAALALTTTAIAKDYPYTVVKGDATQTRVYTLANGLKVYMSVNKEKPRVQANIVVKTGSRNDPAETTGLAHYLEHLMFKGTKLFGTTDYTGEKPYLDDIERRYERYRTLIDPLQRKQAYHEIDSVSQLAARYNIPNEYDKLMASLGSEGSNAYTSNDVTCYVENIPSNEIENWASIQGDRFQNMVIRGFHTELEAVYEEKNISMGSDADKEYAALWKLLTPTHPYGTQTTIGEQEHLKNPSIVNIKKYFSRYYVPNNVAIALAGDFEPDRVIAIIDRHFGSWRPSPDLSRPEFAAQKPINAPKDSSVVGQDAENLMMAWLFKGAADAQNDTLDIIKSMLSNGKAGLFDTNINQQMKTQGVGAMLDELHDYTAFIVQGVPLQGQKLEDVRALILKEIEKLGHGTFSDDLLPAVIANKKLRFYSSLDDNGSRVDMMIDAFINDKSWESESLQLERQAKLTKQDIIDFAQKNLRADNFVCVYKRMGEDSTLKKIEKPAITPIPANREYESKFLNDIRMSKTKPIQPVFIDFNKELSFGNVKKGLPYIYKQNTTDGLFKLVFRYNFGDESDLRYSYAGAYLDFIGTNDMTVSDIKQAFYKLACSYKISTDKKNINIQLSGLNENLPKALRLLEKVLHGAKADTDSWNQFCNLIEKSRTDAKTNQKSNFEALWNYGVYGPYNPQRNDFTMKQLRAMDPQKLVALPGSLGNYAHTVLYYGPYSEKQLCDLLLQQHKVGKVWTKDPIAKPYKEQLTPKNEVIIAPYMAKNIYMRQYHNEGILWNPAKAPIETLFNQYFGGGMNTVVFQELRETRGLAYNAFARYLRPEYKTQPESFYTHIISQNDKMADCVKVFNEILDDMPQNETAFELAKQSLIKSIQSERTTKFNVISRYLFLRQLGLTHDYTQELYAKLPTLTLQDIVDFQRRNIARKPYRYIILGDEKSIDMNTLEKLGPVKRLTTEEIFGY
ncbi:peptidase M16 [Prevotella sp. oral taxon 820]|nr:peptidase M16 [Prevotella sp. oral taxon 820]